MEEAIIKNLVQTIDDAMDRCKAHGIDIPGNIDYFFLSYLALQVYRLGLKDGQALAKKD